VQHAFATFFQLGVFDRFPKLRVVVLESGAGWIGYFLDRADAIFNGTTISQTVRLKEKPSTTSRSDASSRPIPMRRTIAGLMQHVGEDKFFWAAIIRILTIPGTISRNWPGWSPRWRNRRRGILGDNVARAYNLT